MKIAIQGHSTRGKEVIQILESLGGKTVFTIYGFDDRYCYYINPNGIIIESLITIETKDKFSLYTLEEFEKEFPFKIGNEVIFPVKIGWTSGKVTGLTYVEDQLKYEVYTRMGGYHYVESHKLQLYPMKEERNITLTLDKAKEWYKKGGELKEIALQAFTEKELNPLPRSWEEFIESIKFTFKGHLEYIDGIVHWSNSCFPNKSIGESSKVCDKHVALFQLEQLRNYWWGDWKPEWDCCEKHVIKWKKDDLIVFIATRVHAFLVFPTKEMAEEFLKCFRDLIERAGDLI